jgi:hypothetical protein
MTLTSRLGDDHNAISYMFIIAVAYLPETFTGIQTTCLRKGSNLTRSNATVGHIRKGLLHGHSLI